MSASTLGSDLLAASDGLSLQLFCAPLSSLLFRSRSLETCSPLLGAPCLTWEGEWRPCKTHQLLPALAEASGWAEPQPGKGITQPVLSELPA